MNASWTDAAAELAAAHGIDIAAVEGTGADGNVTKADVQAAVDRLKETERPGTRGTARHHPKVWQG